MHREFDTHPESSGAMSPAVHAGAAHTGTARGPLVDEPTGGSDIHSADSSASIVSSGDTATNGAAQTSRSVTNGAKAYRETAHGEAAPHAAGRIVGEKQLPNEKRRESVTGNSGLQAARASQEAEVGQSGAMRSTLLRAAPLTSSSSANVASPARGSSSSQFGGSSRAAAAGGKLATVSGNGSPSMASSVLSSAAGASSSARAAGASDSLFSLPQIDTTVEVGRPVVERVASWMASLATHMVLLVVLGLWMAPPIYHREPEEVVIVKPEEIELPLDTIELDNEEEPTDYDVEAKAAHADLRGVNGMDEASIPPPQVDPPPDLDHEGAELSIELQQHFHTRNEHLITPIPEGDRGHSQAQVEDYQAAMDKITQEIQDMLLTSSVLTVWCFDQSASMIDDRRDIRKRIDRVYSELGLVEIAGNERLSTAIVSYGKSYQSHTPQPVFDVEAVRQAIDQVQDDPSGKEYMCNAIIGTLNEFHPIAKRERRKLAIILVTDESGEPDENFALLEHTIAMCKSANCTVYVLGREAVFGYPYAHIRWIHPQTGGLHWLQIDRGPETAFPEQLQTDGFSRRRDAFGSGFGPYDQSRLAKETGGIFFMIPTEEATVHENEKRRFAHDKTRRYLPSLEPRLQIAAELQANPLKALMWQVINDLNPYDENAAKIIEMRREFSINPAEFQEQVLKEQKKAEIYLEYLKIATQRMEMGAKFREQEISRRWQANYDLLYAQLYAYQARIYEYNARLAKLRVEPLAAPPKVKPPDLEFLYWELFTCKELTAGTESQSHIDQANALFKKIIEEHEGTPWAARAEWEMNRGYGVELRPHYRARARFVRGGAPLMSVPKP